MRRESYIFSAVLHVVVVLLTIFGLPFLWREPPIEDKPLVVDLVPLGEKTNPPPLKSPDAKPEPAKAKPEPKPAPKPQPPKPQPPKPQPPKPRPAPPPPPPPPPPKPEPAPPKPEPRPAPKPQPKPKPQPPKPEPRPQPRKTAERHKAHPQHELESLLKSLDDVKPKPPDELDKLLKSADKLDASEPDSEPKQASTHGSESNNPMEPVSMTELDMIRAQIYRCWNIPAGAKDAADLIVPIRVRLQPDGSVISADIVDKMRYATDSYYRAAADSARRAVLLCSPLKAPPSKYEEWKDLTLRFNPKEMLGQ